MQIPSWAGLPLELVFHRHTQGMYLFSIVDMRDESYGAAIACSCRP